MLKLPVNGPSQQTPAPRLGQHTREVLSEAGVSDVLIEELFKAGTIR